MIGEHMHNFLDAFFTQEFLQRFSAWYWIFNIYCLPPFTFFTCVYIAFFTSYYPLIIFYLFWTYIDKETPYKGGRSEEYRVLRHFPLWKYFNAYFPIKLVKTADLSADKNYLFCYFPHGVMPAGLCGVFANDYSNFNELYPGLRLNCAHHDIVFHIPGLREHTLALGFISCVKKSIRYVLNSETRGQVVVLSPGGPAESIHASPGPYRVVLKERKGFVRIALETGASLVPVFGFGEIDIFRQRNPPGSRLRSLQSRIKRYGRILPVVAYGRGVFTSSGIAPLQKPVTVVVGKPIELERIAEPTLEDIDKYHSLFSESLIELFNEHKREFANDGDESELIIE